MLGPIGILVIIGALMIAIFFTSGVRNPPTEKSKTLIYPHHITLRLDKVRVKVSFHNFSRQPDGYMSLDCQVFNGPTESPRHETVCALRTDRPFLVLPSDTMHHASRQLLTGYELIGQRNGHNRVRLTLRRLPQAA